MSDDSRAPGLAGASPAILTGRSVPSGSGVTAFRGQSPRGHSIKPFEGPAEADPFEEVSPDWSAPPPRSVQSSSEGIGILEDLGALAVGMSGSDTAGRTYTLVAPLDRGGMGELFVASVEDTSAPLGHAVLKRLLPDLVHDRDYVEMFRSEAQVMAQLDHPSVVKVLGMPVVGQVPCLAMEFVDGRSAQQMVARARRLRITTPPTIAAYIAARMARALDYVHHARDGQGTPLELVHRDVSPGNVLLGFDGSVKLTDFGIAKSRMSAVSTTVGIVKGKTRYLAPEQILGHAATPQSDLFSAAVVLVEMLTGRPLFDRGSIPKTLYAIVHGQREAISDLLPPPAAPLADLLELALVADPQNRLPSAQVFADELDVHAAQLGPPVDGELLGQHLRGLFAGTQGPLTRVLRRPSVSLSQPGSAPLDPSAFDSEAPPSESVVEENPMLARSAPREVDGALSMLDWLQTRQARLPTRSWEDAPTAVAAPPSRHRSLLARALALFAAGASVGALVMWLARPFAEPPRWTDSPLATLSLERLHASWSEPPKPPLTLEIPSLQTDASLGSPPPAPGPLPAPATLDIIGPARSRAYIDGKRVRGLTPHYDLVLAPGMHRVEIRRGRNERILELYVQPGEHLRIARDVRRGLAP